MGALNEQLAEAYRDRKAVGEQRAALALRKRLDAAPDLLSAARQRRTELAGVLEAGRRCHISTVYHALLSQALESPDAR